MGGSTFSTRTDCALLRACSRAALPPQKKVAHPFSSREEPPAAPAAPKEHRPREGRNIRRKRRAPRPQETPSLPPPPALRDAFAGIRPARAVQPHMFHAAPAQRPPSGPQPTKKFSSNSRFSAAAPSGVRRHMFPAVFSRAAAAHSAGAAPETIASSALRTGTTGSGLRPGRTASPLQLPKNTGFTSGSAADQTRHDAPAQRPLNARMNDRLSVRPAPSCPPVHRPETPKTAREQPGARAVPAKSRNVLHLFLT